MSRLDAAVERSWLLHPGIVEVTLAVAFVAARAAVSVARHLLSRGGGAVR